MESLKTYAKTTEAAKRLVAAFKNEPEMKPLLDGGAIELYETEDRDTLVHKSRNNIVAVYLYRSSRLEILFYTSKEMRALDVSKTGEVKSFDHQKEAASFPEKEFCAWTERACKAFWKTAFDYHKGDDRSNAETELIITTLKKIFWEKEGQRKSFILDEGSVTIACETWPKYIGYIKGSGNEALHLHANKLIDGVISAIFYLDETQYDVFYQNGKTTLDKRKGFPKGALLECLKAFQAEKR